MPAYLVGAVFFMLVWSVLYALAPRVRSQALVASLGLTHFGPFLEYAYMRDYWRPEYVWSIEVGAVPIALEDCLFGFAVSGLAAGVFAFALPRSEDHGARRTMGQTWWRVQAAGVAFVLANLLLTHVGVNSVHATVALCVIGSAWIYGENPSWLRPGFIAGCATAVLFLFFYELFFLELYPTIIDDWWRRSALSGLALRRVPIEEIAWGFAMGFFIGPLVRLCASGSPAFAARRVYSSGGDVRRTTASMNP